MARSLLPLELWAGIECTHNRVGDRRLDQLQRTGHLDRIEDLDLIHGLGIGALRYPVLWEHVAGDDGDREDWSWADARMRRMRELGMRPILGLLHHGTGPGNAGLVDPAFPQRFAAYARAVAERYSWVQDYIPINEPLTTARFSGLYGVWHPHACDNRVFAQLLLQQLRATILSIRAIREVVPGARFIQNEDIGTIRAVPSLQYQADFENERRWVGFDLLCGMLVPGMRMWDELLSYGVEEPALRWFHENALPPDVIACDNYITSDRLLDARIQRYPAWSHGGNGIDRYADVESVRVTIDEPPGILPVLREAWHRYRRPLAIGEAHIGCTREEQLRWLRDTWRAAELVRRQGADVQAVTVWALFGAYDWNTLVTRDNGYYEPGAFDVRSGPPRPTAIATMLRDIAAEGTFDHPVLDAEGWWRRPERLTYPAVHVPPDRFAEPPLVNELPTHPRTLVVAGESGALLDAVLRVAGVRALACIRADNPDEEEATREQLRRTRSWAVVDVYSCARNGGPVADVGVYRADRVRRTRALARISANLGLPLMLLSCRHASPEDGFGGGLCRSVSMAAEGEARRRHDNVLVIRAGALFSPWHQRDPLVRALGGRGSMRRLDDSPTQAAYVPDVVNAALDLLVDREAGSWHIDHDALVTWHTLHDAALELSKQREPNITTTRSSPRRAPVFRLPTLTDALSRFVRESEPLWARPGQHAAAVVEPDSGPGFEFPAMESSSTLARPPQKQAG